MPGIFNYATSTTLISLSELMYINSNPNTHSNHFDIYATYPWMIYGIIIKKHDNVNIDVVLWTLLSGKYADGYITFP